MSTQDINVEMRNNAEFAGTQERRPERARHQRRIWSLDFLHGGVRITGSQLKNNGLCAGHQ